MTEIAAPKIIQLGLKDYEQTWKSMQHFTDSRNSITRDEIWLVEHSPVYTLGQNSNLKHIFNTGDIPIVQADRGGQVTYHGPGQLLMYTLIDLRRRKLGVRRLVTLLEESVIALLADYSILAHARADAPGVYVNKAKIASLGLRVRRGCSYHGLALNIDLDISPFSRINPCGLEGQSITSLQQLNIPAERQEIAISLCKHFTENL